MKKIVFIFVLFGLVNSNRFETKLKRAAVGPLWPVKKIPFAFSNIIEFDFNEREKIKSTLSNIQQSLMVDGETCLEFVKRYNDPDYILFTDSGDCSSGIGYFPGKNKISLAKNCLNTGTIIHELMHRLGFDHEHSRPDRDENIKVLFDNTEDKQNFELNSNINFEIDAPYDFHSVIHYNSDALQKTNKPTILSKAPILISDANEIYHNREKLTPIDVYKLQRLYKCKTITIPDLTTELSQDEIEKAERIKKRFRTEANFNGISDDLAEAFLNQTFNYCGINNFWPLNYPLVQSSHRLYKLMCLRKKLVTERCGFSIECQDEGAVCVRPFFKKVGYCIKTDNEKINSIGQTVNDSLFQYGKVVKDAFGILKKKIFG